MVHKSVSNHGNCDTDSLGTFPIPIKPRRIGDDLKPRPGMGIGRLYLIRELLNRKPSLN